MGGNGARDLRVEVFGRGAWGKCTQRHTPWRGDVLPEARSVLWDTSGMVTGTREQLNGEH